MKKWLMTGYDILRKRTKKMLTNKTILVTGGTGSLGHALVPMTLEKYNPKRLVIYLRDEMKQFEMARRWFMSQRFQLQTN